jgi:hypothetical protein
MTVGEFMEQAKGHEDCELVVRKHDKWQLSCNTTVPVKSAHVGFDWTMGQFILEPEIQLVTSADEVSMALSEKLKDYSSRLTQHLSTASRIAMMLKEIPDESLRSRIHEELKGLW